MSQPTWGSGVWGQNQWGDQADVAIVATGFALTNTLGDETSAGEVNTGGGRLTWGENAWGEYGDAIVNNTNLLMSATLGTAVYGGDANATNSTNNNQELGVTVGTVTATGTTTAYLTGIAMTNSLGTADAGPDAMATGNHATMGLGSVSAYNATGWGRQHWGDNAWGVEGTWATALVSGIGMTATLGTTSELSGDATITANTLNIAQVTLGAVDVAPDAMIIGEAAVMNLGTLGMQGDVTVSPTGIAMTAAQGTAVLDANTIANIDSGALPMTLGYGASGTSVKIHSTVIPTGIELTTSLGAGSALIWNKVDTGSAPIDPPGWVPVAA